MLVIRLARGGRTKYPVYRIVAAESSRASTGKFIEVLGRYNPHTKELSLEKEQIERRLSHGAQPSNSVAKLLQREGVKLPDWVKLETKSRPPKKEPVVKAEAPKAEEAPVAAEAETASEETPAEDNQERVAEVATENAEEVADNATSVDTVETATPSEPAADETPADETPAA